MILTTRWQTEYHAEEEEEEVFLKRCPQYLELIYKGCWANGYDKSDSPGTESQAVLYYINVTCKEIYAYVLIEVMCMNVLIYGL